MRTVMKHYHDITKGDGTTAALELPCTPYPGMSSKDFLVYEKDGKILLGYLMHDSDVEKPSDGDEYAGSIYSAQRHSGQHEEMQKALGLDSEWMPDFDLLDEGNILAAVIQKLRDDPKVLSDVFDTYIDSYHIGDETRLDYCIRITDENDYEDIDTEVGLTAIKSKLWEEGRKNGTIGNKFAISLDVYEHGLVSYSVSGTGMQCAFDTAKGGAVWVPSKLQLEEIESQAKSSGKTEMEVAYDLAKQDAEVYTDWCNGNCYCTVIVEYDENNVEHETNTCGGQIGDKHAEQALQEMFDEKKQSL